MAGLVERGLRTLCFAKSRKRRRARPPLHRRAARREARRRSRRTAPGTRRRSGARSSGGWSQGELLGVAATNALELGIDVGLLDAVISVGFPGTMASLRQQWGRAGRRGHGLAVLVASEDALDQYFMREPETLLRRRVEAAILDHENDRVLDGHVRAAAFEAPIDERDIPVLGTRALERAPMPPELRAHEGGLGLERSRLPGGARSACAPASPDPFTIVDEETGSVLGIAERERAYSTVHEGAIYLHAGESYRVVDARSRRARARWSSRSAATTTRRRRRRRRRRSRRSCAPSGALGLDVFFGRVTVTEQVVAFQRKAIRDGSTIDIEPLDLPPTAFDTEAVWFLPGARAAARLGADAAAARHAPRGRARADRAAAALGDVRPLGHRRPLDERPLPDRAADDLRVRRPRGRRRHHRARLRRLRGLGRGHRAHDPRLPVLARLPLLRAVAEVRQPERAARQAGSLALLDAMLASA